MKLFKIFQQIYPDVEELHMLMSRKLGDFFNPDPLEPDIEHGPYQWIRVKRKGNGTMSQWRCMNIMNWGNKQYLQRCLWMCIANNVMDRHGVQHGVDDTTVANLFKQTRAVVADFDAKLSKEYLTINKNGLFIGGEPATSYCDNEIRNPEYIMNMFGLIQIKYPTITEIHMLMSETVADAVYQYGDPSMKHGPNQWVRTTNTLIPRPTEWLFIDRCIEWHNKDYVADCVDVFVYNALPEKIFLLKTADKKTVIDVIAAAKNLAATTYPQTHVH